MCTQANSGLPAIISAIYSVMGRPSQKGGAFIQANKSCEPIRYETETQSLRTTRAILNLTIAHTKNIR